MKESKQWLMGEDFGKNNKCALSVEAPAYTPCFLHRISNESLSLSSYLLERLYSTRANVQKDVLRNELWRAFSIEGFLNFYATKTILLLWHWQFMWLIMLSRILLERMTVAQSVKKWPFFYEPWEFIAIFIKILHLSLTWVKGIQSTLWIVFLWDSL